MGYQGFKGGDGRSPCFWSQDAGAWIWGAWMINFVDGRGNWGDPERATHDARRATRGAWRCWTVDTGFWLLVFGRCSRWAALRALRGAPCATRCALCASRLASCTIVCPRKLYAQATSHQRVSQSTPSPWASWIRLASAQIAQRNVRIRILAEQFDRLWPEIKYQRPGPIAPLINEPIHNAVGVFNRVTYGRASRGTRPNAASAQRVNRGRRKLQAITRHDSWR